MFVDCVYLVLNGLLENDFDLVILGINYGVNLGDDIIYLGIVVVVLEGCYLFFFCLVVLFVGKKGNDKYYGYLFGLNYFEIVV